MFHWHVENHGIEHVYITPGTPRLNGKVERSHLSDKHEVYQLPDYKGGVDLEEKQTKWVAFYDFHRPHEAHCGKIPDEVLKKLPA